MVYVIEMEFLFFRKSITMFGFVEPKFKNWKLILFFLKKFEMKQLIPFEFIELKS